ncbi:hypothetical protein JCM18899A_04680 [Nocardioides sp. AN3]
MSSKYARLESERRFLVEAIPDGVVRVSDIVDRYLDGTRLRLREMTTDGVTVRKLGQKIRVGDGPGTVAHTTLYLDDGEWAALSALPGRTLRKRRHHVERGGIALAVDAFPDGSLVAEIDGGDERPDDPPSWLEVVREVTDEESFTGAGRAHRQWSSPGVRRVSRTPRTHLASLSEARRAAGPPSLLRLARHARGARPTPAELPETTTSVAPVRSAHTVEQVRTAEAALMATSPHGALMQRAAAGLATVIADFLGGVYGRRIVLLVGPGDNGGDALYAGARLARRGAAVEAWLLADRCHEAGLAALRRAGGTVTAPRPLSAGSVDLVVDGVLGIGGRPGLPSRVAEAVIPINQSIPFVAVDVPSGLDVDTGERAGMHLRADVTVTFGTHKIAHLADPAAQACGVVELVDIGLELPPPPVEALGEAEVARLLPRPSPDAQKYTRGVVGVRAGSTTYPGAALLAVAGANTGLAGMVRYLGSAAEIVKQHHPEVVGAGRVQAWVVGPGGGDEAARHLEEAVADDVPLVVDADALAHVSGPLPQAVLTPHAGELAAMLGLERSQIEAAPLRHAREAAERYGCVVLLKGRHTVVAGPRVRITTAGTSWLATAGAGDVLSGLIGSLLAAGLSPYDAASVGSWLHGAAATLAAEGGPITATDVARAIPAVVRGLAVRHWRT